MKKKKKKKREKNKDSKKLSELSVSVVSECCGRSVKETTLLSVR